MLDGVESPPTPPLELLPQAVKRLNEIIIKIFFISFSDYTIMIEKGRRN
jgi:hypothetical protein